MYLEGILYGKKMDKKRIRVAGNQDGENKCSFFRFFPTVCGEITVSKKRYFACFHIFTRIIIRKEFFIRF